MRSPSAYVRALCLLTLSDLEELGILRGEARMVLAVCMSWLNSDRIPAHFSQLKSKNEI